MAESLVKQPFYTERDIAGYMKQLLTGLEYMHYHDFMHCGLTVILLIGSK